MLMPAMTGILPVSPRAPRRTPSGGVAPQAARVSDGSYPLARALLLYSAPGIIAGRPQVGEFLSYYLAVVDEEIEKAGYFPADAQVLNRSHLILKAAIGD